MKYAVLETNQSISVLFFQLAIPFRLRCVGSIYLMNNVVLLVES